MLCNENVAHRLIYLLIIVDFPPAYFLRCIRTNEKVDPNIDTSIRSFVLIYWRGQITSPIDERMVMIGFWASVGIRNRLLPVTTFYRHVAQAVIISTISTFFAHAKGKAWENHQ